ncbi:MAG: family transcriptional regulator, cyclic receptor protein [Actinomycetota bacterium]|nr:family transcriptional regulator, cyclic receptor protein [Actinomycetota bacterium]
MLEQICPVIAGLQASDRMGLLARSVPRSLKRGDALFFAGESSGRIHVVVEGVLKLAASDSQGNESILGLAVPGDLVGEISAIDGDPQPLDAIATTACELVGLDADALLRAISASPKAATEMLNALVRRNRWMGATTVERTLAHVPARLAGRLLDLAETLGRMNQGTIELDLPLAQDDLGRLAGMCRESACKTMQKFKRSGVVDYRGRQLRILRPDVLEKIRCAGRAARPSQ